MKIIISTGEKSGDLHGANLILQLKKYFPDMEVFGIGGENLKNAGVKLIYRMESLAVVGFSEVFRKLPRVMAGLKTIHRFIINFKPDLIILVDYPGFNLRLAKFAKRYNIKVVYYISPQVWAWGSWRVRTIRRYVDKMICILPFEAEFYRKAGVDATFVGHPLLDIVKYRESKPSFLNRFGISRDKTIITLLPGSRTEEIKKLLPVMLEVEEKLREIKDIECFLVATPELFEEIKHFLNQKKIHLIKGLKYEAMRYADLILCASGTVTLEALLLETPMIILYKLSTISYIIAKFLSRVPYIGLVNIIAGESIVPEFIQSNASAQRILPVVLKSIERREEIRDTLTSIRTKLGSKGASSRAAKTIAHFSTCS